MKYNLISYFRCCSAHIYLSTQCISSVSLLSNIAASTEPANMDNLEHYKDLINEMKGQSARPNVTAAYGNNNTQSAQLTSSSSSIEAIKSIKDRISVERNDLYSVCPILLYQLTVPKTSAERDGCITTELLPADKHHEHHIHVNHSYGAESDRGLGKHHYFTTKYMKNKRQVCAF